MKVLIDTNVILDVLLKREAFYNEAISVLNLAKKDTVQEYVSASAITDIYYISYRQLRDKERVRELLKNLLVIVSVAGVTEKEILNAINTEWSDFEDLVQYSVALLQNMDGIITRNPSDYKNAQIPIWTPAQALEEVR